MPLFYVKIRKNIDICNYLPIYYPAICRGWRTFSVPSPRGRSSTTGPSKTLQAPSQPSTRGRSFIQPPLTQQEGVLAPCGGLESGPKRHGGVCGRDYHFAIFHHEKYKKHSFCVGFHHFFYNFALGKRDSASPCGYFSRLGAQFYSYGSYINKPTK